MKKKSFFMIVGSVSGLVILTKLLGFVKQMVMANAFGATIQTDLISIAESLVANFEHIIIQVLSTALVPIYIRVKSQGEGEEKKLVSDIVKVFFFSIVALVGSVMLLSPWLARVLAPTYSVELLNELTDYLRILSPVLVCYVFLAIFQALLNANEKFIPGQLVGINGSVIVILFILLLSNKIGPEILIYGTWTAVVVNMCFLGIQSRKYWCIEKGNPKRNKYIQEFFQMTIPLFFGYAMTFINQQVDKVIVSGMQEGTVTAMGYGNIISQLVVVLIATFCTVIFTKISARVSEKNYQVVARMLEKSLLILITGLLPITIITVCFSKEIVNVVFGRGAFDSVAVERAALALAGYSISFIPYTVKALSAKVLYGYLNTKATTISSSVSILFNIVLSLLLYKKFGIFGVTFASSLAELMCAVLNMIATKKMNEYIRIEGFLKRFPIWLIGGVVCTVLALQCKNVWFVQYNDLFKFIISTFVCGGIYLIIVSPMFFKWVKNRV